jgi:tRNA G10  N-methylase Trm11
MSIKNKEEWVEKAFLYWRRRGFPYYDISMEDMHEEFTRVALADPSNVFRNNEIRPSKTGLRLANFFHPQMWEVRVSNCRSPLECFNNDVTLRGCIRKALMIWPNRNSVNESCMRRILKTYRHTAGVSNFRPTAAKAIYVNYSSAGDKILDFSAGYGGRLLGCLPLNREYLGIDPCKKQVSGLKAMFKMLNKHSLCFAKATIMQGTAESIMPNLDNESLDLIFSSPPYFNQEKYCSDWSQSYIRYPDYETWLRRFLENVIQLCYEKLKPKKFFLLNIANIKNFPLSDDALKIGKKYFRHKGTIKMQLSNVPYKREYRSQLYKCEPIHVFYKN